MVLVPLDAFPPAAGNAPGDPVGAPPAARVIKRPDGEGVAIYIARIAELERRIAELRADLAGARQERDSERNGRAAERDRADKITTVLADIARQFAAVTAVSRTRETAIEAKLDAVRAEMAVLRNRPWWARMASLARA